MNRFAVFSIALFLFVVIAGSYGVIHDQITFTIAPEYYTRFKFPQFGMEPYERPIVYPVSVYVAAVGFFASWWMGLIIGLVLCSLALLYPDAHSMRTAIRRSMWTVFRSTIICAVAGYFIGRFYLAKTGVNWWIPAGTTDLNAFITAGSMHNGSYFGGAAGTLIAIVRMIAGRKQNNREEHE